MLVPLSQLLSDPIWCQYKSLSIASQKLNYITSSSPTFSDFFFPDVYFFHLACSRPRYFRSSCCRSWLGQARLVEDWHGSLEELLQLHPCRFCQACQHHPTRHVRPAGQWQMLQGQHESCSRHIQRLREAMGSVPLQQCKHEVSRFGRCRVRC